mmetsp:Transcript_16253/g.31479  ORF Transcript_16253/g.31479 Transcript_16253/m.31479 type:complete len:247 (-) Transcript_16253:25-765(-)
MPSPISRKSAMALRRSTRRTHRLRTVISNRIISCLLRMAPLCSWTLAVLPSLMWTRLQDRRVSACKTTLRSIAPWHTVPQSFGNPQTTHLVLLMSAPIFGVLDVCSSQCFLDKGFPHLNASFLKVDLPRGPLSGSNPPQANHLALHLKLFPANVRIFQLLEQSRYLRLMTAHLLWYKCVSGCLLLTHLSALLLHRLCRDYHLFNRVTTTLILCKLGLSPSQPNNKQRNHYLELPINRARNYSISFV